MDELRVDHSLIMRDTVEFGAVDLRGAHVRGQIDLTRSKVIGPINMDLLHVDRYLLMRDGAEFGALDLLTRIIREAPGIAI